MMKTYFIDLATLAAVVLSAVVFASFQPAFVPLTGSRPQFTSTVQGAPQESSYSIMNSLGETAVVVALLGCSASLLRRVNRRAASPISVHAVRRELAVAYEDSGVELLDNGKFCQGLVGADGAWGRYEFDPIGFSKFYEAVPYLREAELKHGRICMLAWLGLVVPDFVRIPGERYSFEAIPVTYVGHDYLNGSVGANFQILVWITVVELCCAKKVFEWNSLETAGDYGFGAQFLPKDEEGQKRMKMAELKNGRLAMIAFGGAVTQAVITAHPFPWLF